MRAVAIMIGAMGLALPGAAAAQAGADKQAQVAALGECLTMKSTGSDRIAFAGWMVAGLAAAPQLKGIAVVAPDRRDALNRNLAEIFTRLTARDCAEFARPLLKAGDRAAFGSAFEVFGRIAMQELTGNPEAARAMGEFSKYINEADFAELKK
ncbi:MAG: hypothetical protein KGL54_04350 [Sphingomonadales bacterium]|nr:hypothetical protein [Sphingomonadales bacterium]